MVGREEGNPMELQGENKENLWNSRKEKRKPSQTLRKEEKPLNLEREDKANMWKLRNKRRKRLR